MSNIWSEYPTDSRSNEYDDEHGVLYAERVKAQLTKRELEILKLCADGMTTPEIATMLHLAEETVRGYRKRTIYKMRTKNITHSVAIAIRLGIID